MVDDYFIPIYCILPKKCVVKEISISKRWIRNLHNQLIREDYSKQYDGLRAALQRAEAKKVEVEQQIREYLNMTSNLEEHLDDFGFDAQLVKSLVQRIEVSADKRIRIVFGFQDVFADLGKESAGK